jgi:hypothetical protein
MLFEDFEKVQSQSLDMEEATALGNLLVKAITQHSPAFVVGQMVAIYNHYIQQFSGTKALADSDFAALAPLADSMIQSYSACRDVLAACEQELEAAQKQRAPRADEVRRALEALRPQDAQRVLDVLNARKR